MTLQIATAQGDNRYCVVGYGHEDPERPIVIGWTNDSEMAKRVIESMITNWPRFIGGSGKIVDFKRGMTS